MEKIKTTLLLTIVSLIIVFSSKAQPVQISTIPEGSFGFFSALDELYFFNNDSLWKSDGTAAGTIPLKLIGGQGLVPPDEVAFEISSAFFFVVQNGAQFTLWRSNGTAAGTTAINTYTSINILDVLNDQLVFSGTSAGVTNLFKVGTGAPEFIKTITPDDAESINGLIVFEVPLTGGGSELWRTNGTTAGTIKIKDFPGEGLNHFVNVDGTLFFANINTSGQHELWKSNGTTAGTVLVQTFEVEDIFNLIAFQGKVAFIAHFQDFHSLAISDGTPGETDFLLTLASTQIIDLGVANEAIFLGVHIEGFFTSIYRSDGTEEGTMPILEEVGITSEFTPVNHHLFFLFDGLWQSDMSEINTKAVSEIFPSVSIGGAANLTNVNGVLYFTNPDGPGLLNLWNYNPLVPSTPQSYFTVVDSDTDEDRAWLMEGDTIVLFPQDNINIRFNPLLNPESVRFILNGSTFRTENVPPFALAGDNNGNYNRWNVEEGNYTLIAQQFAGNNASGTLLASDTIHFFVQEIILPKPPIVNAGSDKNIVLPTSSTMLNGTASDPDGTIISVNWSIVSSPGVTVTITNATSLNATVSGLTAPGTYIFRLTAIDNDGLDASDDVAVFVTSPTSQAVISFTLVNADTNEDLFTLANGATIDRALLPTLNLNIRANTSPSTVGSVRFQYDASFNRIENQAPYSLFGDTNGDYAAGNLSLGNHTLTARPFTGANAGGTSGPPLTINFSVINSAARSSMESSIKVVTYPNPSSDVFQITIPVVEAANATATMFDDNGSIVKHLFEGSVIIGEELNLEWDATAVNPGMYILKIEMGNSIVVEKLIVK